MTMNEGIDKRYFQYLCNRVISSRSPIQYNKLLKKLFQTNFEYSDPMDENRATDGRLLRYEFGYKERSIESCSMLEMMIALANRCETHLMYDVEIGDRSAQWFWNMVESLGLKGMDDAHYDEEYVNDILERFMKREYEKNGKGSLFTISNSAVDMRRTEIWYQMHLYLGEIV